MLKKFVKKRLSFT